MNKYEKRNKTPPVKEGQMLNLECISIGKKGDGIFKHERFVVVVPETERGKKYTIKVTKVLPTIAFGEAIMELE